MQVLGQGRLGPARLVLNHQLRTGEGDGNALAARQRTGSRPRASVIGDRPSRPRPPSLFMSGLGHHHPRCVRGHLQVLPGQPDPSDVLWSRRRTDPGPVGFGGRRLPNLRGARRHARQLARWAHRRVCRCSASRDLRPQRAPRTTRLLTSRVHDRAQGDRVQEPLRAWTAAGGTNWDRGLASVANAMTHPTSPSSSPTATRPSTAPPSRVRELHPLPRGGERHLLGQCPARPGHTGDRPRRWPRRDDTSTGLNLAAISGPIKYNGSNSAVADYYQTSAYAAAGARAAQPGAWATVRARSRSPR